ncbi:armadillo-like helical domain-containing protein [Tieghemostelium lacteum]|uniref:Armadillo-like helical domain-containing protein n=1 Tax=Tieghemostelium lacteum TaxID=361077 RepID=A0A152A6N5_TIELA|nr:armadillo-like helical domain-containing protein [Tieghemostelium lacteum]|eukprot:KYR01775.1 armadillo-like helical domain-containing protein [Tieghemostelium lacteum]
MSNSIIPNILIRQIFQYIIHQLNINEKDDVVFKFLKRYYLISKQWSLQIFAKTLIYPKLTIKNSKDLNQYMCFYRLGFTNIKIKLKYFSYTNIDRHLLSMITGQIHSIKDDAIPQTLLDGKKKFSINQFAQSIHFNHKTLYPVYLNFRETKQSILSKYWPNLKSLKITHEPEEPYPEDSGGEDDDDDDDDDDEDKDNDFDIIIYKHVPNKVSLVSDNGESVLLGMEIWSKWKNVTVLKLQDLNVEEIDVNLSNLKSLTKLTLKRLIYGCTEFDKILDSIIQLEELDKFTLASFEGNTTTLLYSQVVNLISSLKKIRSISMISVPIATVVYSTLDDEKELEKTSSETLEKLKFKDMFVDCSILNSYSLFTECKALKYLRFEDGWNDTSSLKYLYDIPTIQLSIKFNYNAHASMFKEILLGQNRLNLTNLVINDIPTENASEIVQCNYQSLKLLNLQTLCYNVEYVKLLLNSFQSNKTLQNISISIRSVSADFDVIKDLILSILSRHQTTTFNFECYDLYKGNVDMLLAPIHNPIKNHPYLQKLKLSFGGQIKTPIINKLIKSLNLD